MPQSILLTGKIGVGLSSAAHFITEMCDIKPITLLPEKDEVVDLEKGKISIGIIRRLFDMTKTKSVKKQLYIIDYAERMTIQAQNAFLKLLEEPNQNINFILLSHSTTKLLPTILSRVETVEIKPITLAQSNELLDDLGQTDTTKRAQLLFMACGLPAELTKLINDNPYFEKRSLMIRNARDLLTANLYKKMLIAQHYKDDRPSVLLLLLDMTKILQKSIIDNPQPDTMKLIGKILNTYQQIEANGNIRLLLTRMVI